MPPDSDKDQLPNNGNGNNNQDNEIPTISLTDQQLDQALSEPQELKPISYEAMSILGLSYENAKANGYQPTMMSYEESLKLNQTLLKNTGISEDQYKQLHINVLQESANAVNKKFSWDAMSENKTGPIPKYDQAALPELFISPEALGINVNSKQIEFTIDQKKQRLMSPAKMFDFYGGLYQTQTDEQIAENSGQYKDVNGEVQMLAAYQMMDEQGNRFMIDENGRKKMLVLSRDPFSGTPYYQEGYADKFYKESTIRSLLGPKTKKAKQSTIASSWGNFYNTWLDQTFGTAATVAEQIGMFADWMRGDDESGSLTKWAAEQQNWTAISKSKVSEYDSKLGIFDGSRGFFNEFGNIAANITGVYLGSRLTGLAGLALTGQTQVAGMLAKGAGWTIGAGYASNRMNEQAREMGIEGWKRSLLTAVSGGIVLASEKLLDKAGLSGYLDNMFGDKTKAAKLDELTNNGITSFLRNAGQQIKNAKTEKEVLDIAIPAIANMHKKTYSKLGLLDAPVGKISKLKGVTGGVLGAFARGGSAMKNAMRKSKITAAPLNILSEGGKEGLQEITEEALESIAKISFDYLEENFADNGATIGNGLFGAEMPTLEEFQEIFFAGFVGGGLSGIGRTFDKFHQEQELSNYMISEIAMNHNTKEAADRYLQKRYLDILDNPILTVDNEVIAAMPPEQQATAKSKNDVLYEALQQQLDLAWETKMSYKLNDANTLSEYMNGDTALAKDVIALALNKEYYGRVADDYQKRSNLAESDQEKEALQNKAEAFKQEISRKDKRLNYIMSGQMYSNWNTAMHSTALSKMRKEQNDANILDIKSNITDVENDVELSDEEKAFKLQSLNQELDRANNTNNPSFEFDLSRGYEISSFLKTNGDQLREKINENKRRVDEINAQIDYSIDDDLKELEDSIEENTSSYVNLYTKLKEVKEKAASKNGFSQKQTNRYNNLLEETKKQSQRTQDQLNAEEQQVINDDEKATFDAIAKEENVQASINELEAENMFVELAGYQEVRDEKNKLEHTDLSKIVDFNVAKADSNLEYYEKLNRVVDNKTGEEIYIDNENFDKQEILRKKNEEVAQANEQIRKENEEISKQNEELAEDEQIELKEELEEYTEDDITIESYDDAFMIERMIDVESEQDGQKFLSREKRKKIVLGERLTEDQVNLLRQISQTDNNNQIVNYLAELQTGLNTQKITPTRQLLNKLDNLIKEIQQKQDALSVALQIKILSSQGVEIDGKVKNNLAMDVWSQYSLEDYYKASNYLNKLIINTENLKDRILRNQDLRKQVFEQYKIQNNKINAEISNNFLSAFSTLVEDLPEDNGKKGIYIDDETFIPAPDYINNDDNTVNITDKDIAKAKQFWHYFFNQKDANGDYFVLNDETVQEHIADILDFAKQDNLTREEYLPVKAGNRDKMGNFGTSITDFTLENFRKNYTQSYNDQQGILTSHLNFIREIYISNFFNSVVMFDPYEFENGFTNIIDTVDENENLVLRPNPLNENSPLYKSSHNPEQKNVIEQAYSILKYQDKKNDTKFNNAFQFFDKLIHTELFNNRISQGFPAPNNTLLIEGNAGTGKSSFVVQSFLQMANNNNMLKDKSVVLVAPNQNLLKNLERNAKTAGIPEEKIKTILSDEFINKDGLDIKNSVVILDEFSLHTSNQLQILSMSNNVRQNNGNTFLLLGDKNQAGPDINNAPVESRALFRFIPNMVTVMRSGSADIIGLQDYFRSELIYNPQSLDYRLSQVPQYEFNNGVYKGALVRGGVDAEQRFKEFAKERIKQNPKASLIVFDIDTKLQLESEGFEGNISVITDKDLTPQGQDINEAHVYMPVDTINNITKGQIQPLIIKRYFLTAVSRGEEFVHLFVNEKFVDQDSKLVPNIEQTVLDEEQARNNKIQQYKNQEDILDGLVNVGNYNKNQNPLNKVAEPESVVKKDLQKNEIKELIKGQIAGSLSLDGLQQIEAIKNENPSLYQEAFDEYINDTLQSIENLINTQPDFLADISVVETDLSILLENLPKSKKLSEAELKKLLQQKAQLEKELSQLKNTIEKTFLDNIKTTRLNNSQIVNLLQKEEIESLSKKQATKLFGYYKALAEYNAENNNDQNIDAIIDEATKAKKIKTGVNKAYKSQKKIFELEKQLSNLEQQVKDVNAEFAKLQKELTKESVDDNLDNSNDRKEDAIDNSVHEYYDEQNDHKYLPNQTYNFNNNSYTIVSIEVKDDGLYFNTIDQNQNNTSFFVRDFIEKRMLDYEQNKKKEENKDNDTSQQLDSDNDKTGILNKKLLNEGIISGLGFIAVVDSRFNKENKTDYTELISDRILATKNLSTDNFPLVKIHAIESLEILDYNRNPKTIKALVFTNQNDNVIATYNLSEEAYEENYRKRLETFYQKITQQGGVIEQSFQEITKQNFYFQKRKANTDEILTLEQFKERIEQLQIQDQLNMDSNGNVFVALVQRDAVINGMLESVSKYVVSTKSIDGKTNPNKDIVVEPVVLSTLPREERNNILAKYLTAINNAKLNAGTDTYTIDIQDLAQLEHFFLTNKSAFKNLIADDTTYLNYGFDSPREFFDFKTAAFTDNGKVTGIKSEPTAVSSKRIITAQQQKFIQTFFSNLAINPESELDLSTKKFRYAVPIKKSGENLYLSIKPDELKYFNLTNNVAVHSGAVFFHLSKEAGEVDQNFINENLSLSTDVEPDESDQYESRSSKLAKRKKDTKEIYDSTALEVQKVYRELLGDDHFRNYGGFDFYKKIINPDSSVTHGKIFRDGKMFLAKALDGSVNLNAAYHEIIHFVDFFLLDSDKKNKIYEEVYRKTGLTGKQAREYVADVGAQWMTRRKRMPGWSQMFFNFLDWLAYHFRNLGNLLGFSNYLSNLHYDIYYKKAYSNSNIVNESAPEFDGSQPIESRSSSNIQKKYGQNKTYALQEAKRAISFGSKDLLTTDLSRVINNPSLFNYDNIINNIEYYNREIILNHLIKTNPTYTEKVNDQDVTLPIIKYETKANLSIKNPKLENISVLKVLNPHKLKGDSIVDSTVTVAKDTSLEKIAQDENMPIDVLRNANKDVIKKKKGKEYVPKNSNIKIPGSVENAYDVYTIEEQSKKIAYNNKSERTALRKGLREILNKVRIKTEDSNLLFFNLANQKIENLLNTNNQNLKLYTSYLTLDDQFLIDIIKKEFPKLDLGNPSNPTQGLLYGYDEQAADRANLITFDTVSKKDNDKTRVTDRQSDALKYSISNIPLLDVVFKNGKYEIVKVNEEQSLENGYVEQRKMHKMLSNNVQQALSQGTSLDPFRNITDFFDKKYNELLEEISNKNTEELGNYILLESDKNFLTFYDFYFNKDKLSHRMIINLYDLFERNKNAALQQYNNFARSSGYQQINDIQAFENNFEIMYDNSVKVLSAILNHYSSIISPTRLLTEYRNYSGDSVTKITEGRTSKDFIHGINGALKNAFFDENQIITEQAVGFFIEGTNKRLNRGDKENPKYRPAQFRFENDGIYFYIGPKDDNQFTKAAQAEVKTSDNYIKVSQIDSKGKIVFNNGAFTANKTIAKDQFIKAFFEEIGLGTYFDTGLYTIGDKLAKDNNTIARVFNNLAYSSYVYAFDLYSFQEKDVKNVERKLVRDTYFNALQETVKRYGVSNLFDILNVNNDETIAVEDSNVETYSPDKFYQEIKQLADILENKYGESGADTYKTIKGEEAQSIILSNSEENLFTNLPGTIQAIAQQQTNKQKLRNTNNALIINNEVQNLNPLQIDSEYLQSSHRNEGARIKNRAGKQIDNMTHADRHQQDIGIFINHINEKFDSESILIPVFNKGERKTQNFDKVGFVLPQHRNASFLSNGIFMKSSLKDTDKKQEKLTADSLPSNFKLDVENILSGHLSNLILIKKANQVKSLNNWIEFINRYTNQNIQPIQILSLDNIDYSKRDEAVVKLYNAITDNNTQIINTINSVKKFLEKNNLTEADFINNPILRKSKDLIRTKTKDGIKYSLGFDATNNADLLNGSKQGPDGVLHYNNLNKKITVNKFKESGIISTINPKDKINTMKISFGDLILLESFLTKNNLSVFTEKNKTDKVGVSSTTYSRIGTTTKESQEILSREDIYNKIIDDLFQNLFKDSHKHAKKRNYRVNRNSKPGIFNKKTGANYDAWKGFLISFYIHNTYKDLSQGITPGTYVSSFVDTTNTNAIDSSVNKSKRNNIATSPGQREISIGKNKLPEHLPILMLEDPSATVSSYNESTGYNESLIELFDGEIVESPVIKRIKFKLHGQEVSPLSNKGPRKKINHSSDLYENELNQFKSAQFDITGQSLQMSEAHQKLLRILLDPQKIGIGSLYNMYENLRYEGMSFDEAIETVAEEYLKNPSNYSILYGIAFDSSRKNNSGTHSLPVSINGAHSKNSNQSILKDVNPNNDDSYNDLFDLYERSNNPGLDRYTTKYNTKTELVQLNANKPINDDQESPMEQLMSIILANPNLSDSSKTDNVFTEISNLIELQIEIAGQELQEKLGGQDSVIKTSTAELIKKIDQDIISKEEDAVLLDVRDRQNAQETKNFLMQKVKEALERTDDTTLLSRLIDANIKSPDIGGVSQRVVQYLASYITKSILKTPTAALRVIQEAGEHINIYEVLEKKQSKDGKSSYIQKRILTYETAKQYALENNLEFDSLENTNSKLEVQKAYAEAQQNVDAFDKPVIFKRKLEQERTEYLELQDAQAQSDVEFIERTILEGQKDISERQNKLSTIDRRIDKEAYQNQLDEIEKGKKAIKELRKQKQDIYKKQGALQIIPGEIIMPNTTLVKYGIDPNNSFQDLFTITTVNEKGEIQQNTKFFENVLERYNADKIKIRSVIKDRLRKLYKESFGIGIKRERNRMVITTNDDVVNYQLQNRNPILQVMIKSLNQEQNRFVKQRDRQQSIIDGDNSKTVEQKNAEKKQVRNNLLRALPEEAMNRAVNLATDAIIENYLKIDLLSVRTPSGPGSGHIAALVETLNDNGSTALYNTRKNDKDDSDQDIDQNTIYFYEATYQELGYTQNEINELGLDREQSIKQEVANTQNKIKNFVFNYYKDYNNDNFTKIRTDVEKIKSFSKNEQAVKFHNNSNDNSYFRSIEISQQTANAKAVGVFALGTKTSSSIISANNQANTLNNDGVPVATNLLATEVVDDQGEVMFKLKTINSSPDYKQTIAKVLDLHETHVHGATITAKETVLDIINATRDNGMLLNTMVLWSNEMIHYWANRQNAVIENITAEQAIYGLMRSKAMQDVISMVNENKNMLSFFKDRNIAKAAFAKYNRLSIDEKDNQAKLQKAIDEINNQKEIVEKIIKGSELKLPSNFKINNKNVSDYLNDLISNRNTSDDTETVVSKKATSELQNILYNILNKSKELAQQEYENDNDLEKTIYTEAQIIQERETEEGKTFIASEIMQELLGSLTKMQNSIYRRNQLYLKLNSKYNEDLFQIAKMAIMSEVYADYTQIASLNQGVPNNKHDVFDLKQTIEKLTGYSLSDLINMYDNWNKKDLDTYIKENIYRKTIKEIQEFGFKDFQNALARDKWRTQTIQSNKTQYGVEVTEQLNFYDMYHKIIDPVKMLFLQPNLMARVKQFTNEYNTIVSTFVTISPVFTSTVDPKIKELLGIDRFTKEQFQYLQKEKDNLLVSMYFSEPEVQQKFTNALNIVHEKASNIKLNHLDGVELNVDFSDMFSRSNFAKLFPRYFFDVIIDAYGFKTSEYDKDVHSLMDALYLSERNNSEYIAIKANNKNLNPNEENTYSRAIQKLPQEVKQLIEFYEVVKFGMYYSQSAFSKIMDVDIQVDYSNFINLKLQSEDIYKKPFARKLLDNFVEKIVSDPMSPLVPYGRPNYKETDALTGQYRYEPPVGANGLVKYFKAKLYEKYNAYTRSMEGIPVVKKLDETINTDWLPSATASQGYNINILKATGNEIEDSLNPNLIKIDGVNLVTKLADKFNLILLDRYKKRLNAEFSQDKYKDLRNFFNSVNINSGESAVRYKQELQPKISLQLKELKTQAKEKAIKDYSELDNTKKDQIAKNYRNNLHYLDTLIFDLVDGAQESYTIESSDIFDPGSKLDYDTYQKEVIVEYVNLYAQYIKDAYNNTGENILQNLIDDSNNEANPKQKIFKDNNRKSYIKPSIALSFLLKEYNNIASKEQESKIVNLRSNYVINDAGSLNEPQTGDQKQNKIFDIQKSDSMYIPTRNAISSFTNNHDLDDSHVIDLDFVTEKTIIPLILESASLDRNDTNENQIRNLIKDYHLKYNNSSDNQNIDQWLIKQLQDRKLYNPNVGIDIPQLLSNLRKSNKRTIPSISKEQLSKHQSIIDNSYDGTVTVKQQRSHNYKVGDIIYLQDGNIGVVTSMNKKVYTDGFKQRMYSDEFSYKILKKESVKQKKTFDARIGTRALTIKENNKRKLRGVAKVFAKSTPNVIYKFITEQDAIRMGKGDVYSFIGSDGVIYINEDKADSNVMLHEFSHPFLLQLELNDPETFNFLYESLKGTPLDKEVSKAYGDVDDRFYKHELIANFLQKRSEIKKMPNLFQRFYDAVKQLLYKIFRPGTYSAFNKLDFQYATHNDIADAIIEDIFYGRNLSNITTQEMSEMLEDNYLDSRQSKFTLENLKYFTMPKPLHTQFKFSDSANNIRSQINKSIENQTRFTAPDGTVVDFSENAKDKNGQFLFKENGVFIPQKRNDYITQKVEEFAKLDRSIENKFLEFLNETKKSQTLFDAAQKSYKKSWDRYSASTTENQEFARVNEDKLSKLLIKMGFNKETDKAVLLSDLKDKTNLDVAIDRKLFGSNPIVIIHNWSKNKIGNRVPRISIVNVTTSDPEFNHQGLDKDGNTINKQSILGQSYYDRLALESNGVKLKNNVRDLNFLINTIQGMAIKEAFANQKDGTNVKIESLQTIYIRGDREPVVFKEKIVNIIPQLNFIFQEGSKIQEDLDESIKVIVNNKKLNDINEYRDNFIDIIRDFAESKLTQFNKSNPNEIKAALLYENIKEYADSVEQGTDRLSKIKLSNLLLSVIKYKRSMEVDYNVLQRDPEFMMLNQAYMKLKSIKSIEEIGIKDLGLFEFWLQSADRWDDDYSNFVTDQIQLGIRKAKADYIPFMNQNKIELDKLQNVVNNMPGFTGLGVIKPTSKEFFKPLIKTTVVPVYANGEYTGETKEVSLHEIHWDINNPETQAAIKKGTLTEQHVAYGKFLMDSLEEEFIKFIKYKESKIRISDPDFRKMSDAQKEKFLDEIARDKIKYKWQKGMLPIIPKKATDALAEDGVKKAAEIYWKNATRIEGAYDDYFMDDEYDKSNRYKLVPNNLWSQFNDNENYGSQARLRRLGLTLVDGSKLVLESQHQHNMVSFDIADIASYTMMSSARTRNMDEAVEAVNIANDLIHSISASTGQDVTKTLERIKVYSNRNIYGELPASERVQVAGLNIAVDNMINTTVRGLTTVVMGLGPTLAMKNFLSSQFSGVLAGVGNQIAGSHEFETEHFTQAWNVLFQKDGWKKIQSINDKLQLVAMSERELLNSFIYNKQKRNLFESDANMFLHFAGDYITKLTCMTAQMIKDGTFDAYDIDGNYDYRKDKRFYTYTRDNNGQTETYVNFSKMSEEGEALYNFTKQQLIEDNLYGQRANPDGDLQGAYFAKQIQSIEVMNQRAVHDVTNSEYKDHASAYGLARAIFPLKNFIKTKWNQYTQKPHKESKTGFAKVEKIMKEDGTYEFETTWEKLATEGIVYTIFDVAKKMKEYRMNPAKTWDALNVEQKKNLLKLTTHSVFFMGVSILLSLIFDDEEDEQGAIEYVSRKAIGGAAAEKIVDFNPLELYNQFINSPNLILSSFENLYNIFLDTLSLPFNIFEDDFAEKLRKYLYDATRLMPGGALVRDASNMFDGFIDYMTEN